MTTLALFQWLAHSSLGQYLQRSQWAFAVVETIHLLALAVLGGSLVALSLRAVGLLRNIGSRRLARELLPLACISFAAMATTGVLMVAGEALKCYYNDAFRAKMAALAVALVLSVPIYLAQALRRDEHIPWWLRVGAVFSLLAWLSVGAVGRAIGFI